MVVEDPHPTRSTTDAAVAQAARVQVSVVPSLTSATVPPVPDIAIVPVASGVGRSWVPPVPVASWTR